MTEESTIRRLSVRTRDGRHFDFKQGEADAIELARAAKSDEFFEHLEDQLRSLHPETFEKHSAATLRLSAEGVLFDMVKPGQEAKLAELLYRRE